MNAITKELERRRKTMYVVLAVRLGDTHRRTLCDTIRENQSVTGDWAHVQINGVALAAGTKPAPSEKRRIIFLTCKIIYVLCARCWFRLIFPQPTRAIPTLCFYKGSPFSCLHISVANESQAQPTPETTNTRLGVVGDSVGRLSAPLVGFREDGLAAFFGELP